MSAAVDRLEEIRALAQTTRPTSATSLLAKAALTVAEGITRDCDRGLISPERAERLLDEVVESLITREGPADA